MEKLMVFPVMSNLRCRGRREEEQSVKKIGYIDKKERYGEHKTS